MSGEPTVPGDPDELRAAEYALGTLPHAERQAFADRLRAEPALRVRVERWEALLLPMAEDIEPVDPPPALAGRIEERLFGAAPASAPRRAIWPWRAFALASFVGMVVFGGLYFDAARDRQAPPRYLATVAGQTGAVRLAVIVEPDAGTVTLRRQGARAPAGRDYELWLIAGDRAPVSLGVLPAMERAEIALEPELRALLDTAVLAVSDEPAGGSPTGQPTGPVLATGPVVGL